MNREVGYKAVTVDLEDQYYNMGSVLEKDMRPVKLAKMAYQKQGIRPNIQAVRGGTDGSILTFKGLPTPDIFSGQENMHGRYEYISLESMVKATQVIVQIVIDSKHYYQLDK